MAKFIEIERNKGVDSNIPGTEWMMVPVGKPNLVVLEDGEGFAVRASEHKEKITILEVARQKFPVVAGKIVSLFLSERHRLFMVTGKNGGEARIAAKKDKSSAEIKVSVHGSRTFSISFFFLQDVDAKKVPVSRTVFGPKDAKEWVEGLNSVYGSQANIWFKLGKAVTLALPGLESSASASSAQLLADHKDTQIAPGKGDLQVPIRVFLAGSSLTSQDSGHPNGFFHIATKVILMKDQVANVSQGVTPRPMLKTLAHEIGHFMTHVRGAGQGHEFYKKAGYQNDILNTLDGNDIKIPKQRVYDWNPW